MNKILFVTGTRADYGLLRKLILLFKADAHFETSVAATGTHLSEKHGKTIDIVKQDMEQNLFEVDMKISSDSPSGISASIAQGIQGFSDLYKKTSPQAIVVLGDRYELWAACVPAAIYNIPLIHIHGGESTEGLIDEAVRHSVTKMSHLHFCSHEHYRSRIIKMGEQPAHVFNVGAIGLDRIKDLNLLTQAELAEKLGVTFGAKNILCTFHPVTLDEKQSSNEVDSLMGALDKILTEQADVKLFITLPNADTFSNYIREGWDSLIQKNPTQVKGFTNLGDLNYLSLVKNVNVVVGNSSSGILEVPFLKKAVVNIGRRQEGRLQSEHILNCQGKMTDIHQTITKALSEDFQKKLPTFKTIYGEGHASQLIYEKIKGFNFDGLIFKKFYDGTNQ